MKSTLAPAAFAVAVAIVAALACGSSKRGFDATDDGGLLGASGGPGELGTEGGSDGGACKFRCSSDLHDVLDCSGNVLQHCPPDQGCGGASCVPACDSAQANKSSIGCDYYSVDPDSIFLNAGSCFAAFVVNTWPAPVTVTVERGGQTFDVGQIARIPSGSGQSLTYAPLPSGQIPAGGVAILFLARNGTVPTDCPAGTTPAVTSELANVHGTGMGKAFHIVTSAPVVAYDMYPYGGGQSAWTSATMLIPSSAWDTNYIAVNAYANNNFAIDSMPTLAIVAQSDDTHVTIRPSAAITAGGGLAATAKGQPGTYTLGRGQVLQFSQPAELTGSPIQSDKPIGVWGGATCLNVPTDKRSADGAHQQLPPVKALGHEYVGVRYRNRFDNQEETPPWRLVGAVDGTVLTWDPTPPAGAPLSLNEGAVAEIATGTPFTVRSQDDAHPFYVAAYMTGGEVVDPAFDDERGDPEFVNVVPPQQWLSSYVFFTDPTYPETNVVVVRTRGAAGFEDVTLDCAGKLAGWAPIGAGGQFEFTRVDLVRHNFEKQGGCDNGRHEISSRAPFGITVWGWGSKDSGGSYGVAGGGFYSQAVSYAYPAGASVQPINGVFVPPTVK
jgi:IgGFc binding protein